MPFDSGTDGSRGVKGASRTTVAVVAALALTIVAGLGIARSGQHDRGEPTSAGPGAASGAARIGAVVSRVVDGDTIVIRVGSASDKVRLIGIDTPESVKPGTPVQCFALEASARTKALVPPGTPVRLDGDVEPRDRYGRRLAYVYRARDNLFVNLVLVREGYAVPYTFPPDVAHADEFVSAAADARAANAGLWGKCGDDIPMHRLAPLPSPP